MSGREDLLVRFLAGTPWASAERLPLSGDASFRRYERLVGGPHPAMLMDAPPPQEDVRPYLTVARHLTALGFSAPRIHVADAENGFLIIEDLGDATYTREIAGGAEETPLYELAIDTLVALHRHDGATAAEVPPYDAKTYLREARLLTDWYLPAVRGRDTSEAEIASYEAVWRALLPLVEAVPKSLVLRDYHVDNLMVLDGREGIARCGLLDFQDALIGPVAYDLVSLLEDARRDVAPDLRAALWHRYLDAFPDLDPDALTAAGAVLAAQRNCKIIGIFTRLLVRDGKPVYLQHIPRVWRLLEGDMAHPALAPLRDWLDRAIPPGERTVPRQD